MSKDCPPLGTWRRSVFRRASSNSQIETISCRELWITGFTLVKCERIPYQRAMELKNYLTHDFLDVDLSKDTTEEENECE